MAKLSIVVVDPPNQCIGYDDIELVMSTKEGESPPVFVGADELRFDVEIDIRPDRSGDLQGWGPAVNRQGDGIRFVYLAWIGTQNGRRTMFRRLKVGLDLVPGFPGSAKEYTVRVRGRDKRGEPACARAVLADD